ncbi:hypothetical protein UlMin_042582 [Ulmus minor]
MDTSKKCKVFEALLCLLVLVLVTNCSASVSVSEALAKKELIVEEDDQNSLNTYIVFAEKPNGVSVQSGDLSSWYESFLPAATTTNAVGSNKHPRLVHAYQNVVTGFAAKLSGEEVKEMEKKKGFVSARKQRMFSLQTTHSPSFLGLNQNLGLWNESKLGNGVIVGLLDTGISPDHPSFSDEGVPPPPAKWKGSCEFTGALCNNKLIGAKNFATQSPGELPFDEEGHGTHTSSTAAGNFVKGANVFGNAKGTAVGMAPYAHLAIYKVCGSLGCSESDILAALDAAVGDGVDVLSLSLGGGSAPFYADSIAIGAFAATQKGIFVSCSAGNEGPDYGSLSNEAPWILTVGASTIDRKIKAVAQLGNGQLFEGESLFQPKDFTSALLPLVYPGANGNQSLAFCAPGALKDFDVQGKVVVCDRGGDIGRIAKGQEVKSAGGAAMILTNQMPDGFSTLADAHVLPATHVSYVAGLQIKSYYKTSSAPPTATILFKGTVIGDSTAPAITSFSSRGPNLASNGILKPDIVGPGVSILAAWPVSVDNCTTSKATFNIISGTSMSCPHLSGIAALLKSSHPDWSPAAIKSAIMTTADTVNLRGRPLVDEKASPADIFATGAGHVNPSKANHPGLIYDLQPEDYIPYLCGLNYTDQQVSTIVQTSVKCSDVTIIPEGQLNYPSFSLLLGSESQTFTRTVTNVGEASSTYTVEIFAPEYTGISVNPRTITFTEVNQKAQYTIEIIPASGAGTSGKDFSQGYVKWVSDKYSVRSQISVIYV